MGRILKLIMDCGYCLDIIKNDNMAKSTDAQLKKIYQNGLDKIDALYAEFKREMARLKAERRKIISDLSKNRDDERIKEILRSIK